MSPTGPHLDQPGSGFPVVKEILLFLLQTHHPAEGWRGGEETDTTKSSPCSLSAQKEGSESSKNWVKNGLAVPILSALH